MDTKQERAKRIIDNMIENIKDATIDYGLDSKDDIKFYIHGMVTSVYKTDTTVTPEQRDKLANAIYEAVVAARFGNKNTLKVSMKIYIARDRAVFEDEQQERFIHRHPEKENQYGRLRLFYEKPKFNHQTGVWEQARGAAEIKNYMFPQIKCEECAEFEGPAETTNDIHYPGMFITL